MIWQLFITLNILAFSVTTILQKVLVRESKSKPIAYAIVLQLLTGIFVIIVGFLLHQLTLFSLSKVFLNLIFAVFLYASANVFIFQSLKQTEASKFTVVFATRLLFTILASSLFLEEVLKINQLTGAILIFLGVIIISLQSARIKFTRGDMYALLAAICFGLANTNSKFILHSVPVYMYMTIIFITPALVLSVMFPKEAMHSPKLVQKKNLFKITVVSICNGLANIGFFTAIKLSNNASIITAASLTSIIVTVLLSVVLLKERTNLPQKIIGMILSFAGLLLLVL